MQIDIEIDPACGEPRVVIYTDRVSDEVLTLKRRLQCAPVSYLTGFSDSRAQIIDPSAILRVATVAGKVVAFTENGEYRLRMRLYEAEARLDTARFVRISQSEIVNIRAVEHFDFSTTGTIEVHFNNGDTSYVSRRYIPRIRKLLGL